MSDLIGKIISRRYRVESFLGKGGMAEVYKVWDMERNVHLAMKVLHADLAEDRVFLRRFKREAQTLATLQHPNIVRFYGLEQDEDLVFMLMDYVEGITLRKEIFQAKVPLSLERIQEIMRSVCAALYYAHKSGFVHCDVKPANIMIQKNGNVLVADFGISRMTEASTVTMVGAGTPAYMSPEQIKGNDPIPQMDIYALGVVLFEMLTGGERPFTGENAQTTGTTSEKVRWEQLQLAAPPPSSYNPAITPDIDAIVLKCLNKSPTSRYLSAMDLYGDLINLNNVVIEPLPKSKAKPSSTESEARDKEKQKLQEKEPVITPPSQTNNTPADMPRVTGVGINKPLKVAAIIGAGLFFLCILIFALSRTFLNNSSAPQATYSSTPTLISTHTVRSTSTKIPSTPTRISPTKTQVPPTSTPASLGQIVKYKSLEISVLDVYRHDKLIPGNGYRYWANDGYMIIDLVVKVQNTGATPTSIIWNDAYVIDDTGAHTEIIFAGSRSVAKTEKIDPLSIDYSTIDGTASIEIKDTVYMRVIYIIPDKPEQTAFFSIKDSPLIGFTVKK